MSCLCEEAAVLYSSVATCRSCCSCCDERYVGLDTWCKVHRCRCTATYCQVLCLHVDVLLGSGGQSCQFCVQLLQPLCPQQLNPFGMKLHAVDVLIVLLKFGGGLQCCLMIVGGLYTNTMGVHVRACMRAECMGRYNAVHTMVLLLVAE